MATLNNVLAYLEAVVNYTIFFSWSYMHISQIACGQKIMSCLFLMGKHNLSLENFFYCSLKFVIFFGIHLHEAIRSFKLLLIITVQFYFHVNEGQNTFIFHP
jgi:hypothetical protein